MMETVSILIAVLSLVISTVTAWLTLFRHGTIHMTRPTMIYFGPDGPSGQGKHLKVTLRTLLYSTAEHGRVLENMYIRLTCGGTTQNFNIWVHGDGPMVRGSGIYVGKEGTTC